MALRAAADQAAETAVHDGRAGRAGGDERARAQGRPRAPQVAPRRRDVQRGPGARSAARRRPARLAPSFDLATPCSAASGRHPFHVFLPGETVSAAAGCTTYAVTELSEFDRGVVVGLLVGEGSFGGDGKQPQVTLRMHTRHEALFHWLMERFPDTRLYGPYHHGGRSYYQWMARGTGAGPGRPAAARGRADTQRWTDTLQSASTRCASATPATSPASEHGWRARLPCRASAVARRSSWRSLASGRATVSTRRRASSWPRCCRPAGRGSARANDGARPGAGDRRSPGRLAGRAGAARGPGRADDRRPRRRGRLAGPPAGDRAARKRVSHWSRARRASASSLQRAIRGLRLGNVDVVNARAEDWPDGLGRFELVTARALAPLEVVVEYAAPLLRDRRHAASPGGAGATRTREAAGGRAAAALGPARSGRDPRQCSHIQAPRTVTCTSCRRLWRPRRSFPRRPGMAVKRPLGCRRCSVV